ncbi:hypothetical protein PFISCL1PPCAC_23382, partial [Pristionchus fissidentatus]
LLSPSHVSAVASTQIAPSLIAIIPLLQDTREQWFSVGPPPLWTSAALQWPSGGHSLVSLSSTH